MKKILLLLLVIYLFNLAPDLFAQANPVRIPIPNVNISIDEATKPKDIALSLQILFLLSILTLAPSIVILTTAFLRIAIVLDFLKKALSLQQMPPNQVIFGLALFMTFFIMWPTFDKINREAIQPFVNQESLPREKRLTLDQFFEKSIGPLREFMFRQTDQNILAFYEYERTLCT